ncbi:MAG: arabinan endo,5-alpha-L-arabinosidase, partial [Mycobacteriales bacterium]
MARFRVWLAGTAVLALLPGTAPPAVAAAAPAASAPRATAPVPRATVPGAPSADPIAHDPTLIKEGRYYYDIITGAIGTRTYLPVRRSTDLVHWTFLGPVFTTPPAWVTAELGLTPGDFWAPDINYFAGEYHLYYAASSFGTNNSVIGLATTPTLDPGSPAYHWTDRGMVIRSRGADNVNAIDPDVVFDAAGVPWLSFGSFWDGITMRRLDASSGLLSTVDTTAYRLASRGGASIEGPSIVRHGGYYYLFVSLDYCCRGVESDYRVVVGRSREVTGPYQDASGAAMLAGGGTEVLRGYSEFRGTGGGDIYQIHGVDLFAHHYYDHYDNGTPKLSVRAVSWRGGWPRLGDPLSGSRQLGRGSAYFTLVSRASGAVVENVGCGYEGAGIALAAGTGSPCQQWRPDDRDGGYVSLGNRFSNKVAEVAACVNADGARVAQWGWLANACQEYRF